MSRFNALSALLLAASLAACGSSGNPPSTINDNQASSQMPQPPNSMPSDAGASAAPSTGVVSRTRVGRSRRYATRHTVRHRRVHRRARPAAATPSTTAQ